MPPEPVYERTSAVSVGGGTTGSRREAETTTGPDWLRLFSDERFRMLSRSVYADHCFIKDTCRLGHDRFVSNSVDEALLQLCSTGFEIGEPCVVGAPFTPCHWGTLAVLAHLFRDGNHDLRAHRTVYWLTTERGELALFSRLRLHRLFHRIADVAGCTPFSEIVDRREATSLVILRGAHELSEVPAGHDLVVSDARGELVFRKGEAEELVRRTRETGSLATVIVPSQKLTYWLAEDAVCWPWSEAAIASMHVRERLEGDALPWRWEAGAHVAGRTRRRVHTVTGVKPVDELLVELRGFAHKLFSQPKTFSDMRIRIEFQRVVAVLREMAIPFEELDRGDDERRPSARLRRLQLHADKLVPVDTVSRSSVPVDDRLGDAHRRKLDEPLNTTREGRQDGNSHLS